MILSELISIKDAFKIMDKTQKVKDCEIIPLEDSHLRVLGEDIHSYHDSPPFDKSAMDGYALIAKDTFGASTDTPKTLNIIEEIGAGDFSEKEISDNEAIRIATGAPIPKGADAVLMEEFTASNGDKIEIHTQVPPSENIVPQGEDIKKGKKILVKGTILKPSEIGLIASAGYAKIKVYKKPKVKLLITGNELVNPSKTIEKAQIINSNKYLISSMIRSIGGIVDTEHLRDDADLVKIAILKASKEFDIVLTTGGTAISKGDVIVDVIDSITDVLFHGVGVRPGRPIAYAEVENTPIFMLSGYPIAAISQFDIFIRRYIFKMQSLNYDPTIVKRESKVKIPSDLGRTDYVRAFTDDKYIIRASNKGSGIIHSMVQSNSYLIIDDNSEGIEKGDMSNIIFFKSMLLY
ncbi:MAG: molybdopterin molybdotransferase MoeA [Methanobrevibacter sp.]|jgi:molybdopterin molybdotransferase|nr:molybdopterin molybdotransferase MoeA [Methanobrevibacter sp.]